MPVLVVLITALVFIDVLGYGFADWDDTTMLVDHVEYRVPGWQAVRFAFTTTHLGHYAPLAWLSFTVDTVLWGAGPRGHHLTNLLLHAANVALFCWLARQLLRHATPLAGLPLEIGAATAALAFGLHPMRAESVAWITERRGVLSGCFALLAILAYLRAVTGGWRRRWLAASAGSFLMALLAKESALVLPAGLVILDVYPLGRLSRRPLRWLSPSAWPIWREKIPHFALAGVWSVIAYRSQLRGADVVRLDPETWIAVVVQSLWHHVEKTLSPVHLSPLYEFPGRIALAEPRVVLSGIGVIAVTVIAFGLRRRCPALLAAWTWQVAALAPFMALSHAGQQLTADRYGYLAMWGWALVLGGAVAVAVRAAIERRAWAVALGVTWVLAFAALAGLAAQQAQIWHDRGTLWTHAVSIAPDCVTCRFNLATWLLDQGDPAAALAHFEEIRERHPTIARFHGASGVALGFLGRYAEAETHFRHAIDRLPGASGGIMRLNLAGALIEQRRFDEGVRVLREAVRAWSAEAAVRHLEQAIRATPRKPIFRLALAEAYGALGRSADAAAERALVAELHPELARVAGGTLAPRDPPSR